MARWMKRATELESMKSQKHESSFHVGEIVIVKSVLGEDEQERIEDMVHLTDPMFMKGKWLMFRNGKGIRWVHHSLVLPLSI